MASSSPVITKEFSCWPFCHQWQRWIDISTGKIADCYSDKIIGEFIVQERRCNRCEKVQLRVAKT